MGIQSTTWGLSRSEVAVQARKSAEGFKPLLNRNLRLIRQWDGNKRAPVSARVVWRGLSQIPNSEGKFEMIRLVLTNYYRVSENIKTGPLLQYYIFTDSEFKHMAAPICGDCPHATAADGKRPACYVQWARLGHAWNASERNQELSTEKAAQLSKGLRIRLGSAGDPAAVPMMVWSPILAAADGHTGYTHQWDKDWAQPYAGFLMASVDSATEAELATAKGWRYFGIETPGKPLQGEFKYSGSNQQPVRCLSEASNIACINCMLCNGNANLEKTGKRAPSIVITAHGPGAVNLTARIP